MIRLLEEISLAAWPAIQTMLLDGWVLRFANGYTRRANSVQPLYPSTQALTEKIETCEQFYRAQGLKSTFKLTPASEPAELDARLETLGYQSDARTSVQLLELDHWSSQGETDAVLTENMTPEWFEAYCALGRVGEKYQATLCRMLEAVIPEKRLAVIRQRGQVAACGMAVRQGDFVGFYDIVVAEASRRQGYGRRLMESLMTWGQRAGARRAYLQVMVENAPAWKLYAQLGFREEYQYWYRVKA